MGLFSRGEVLGIDASANSVFSREIERFQKELINSSDMTKEFERFGKIINKVFSKAIGISYKFTYEDLKLETKEHGVGDILNDRIDSLCDIMGEMEFDHSRITKEKLLDASNSLISLVSLFEEDNGKKPVFSEEKMLSPEEISLPGSGANETKNAHLDVKEDSEKEISDIPPPAMPVMEKEKKQGFFQKIFSRNRKEPETGLPEFEAVPVSKIMPPELPENKELIENKDILEIKEPEDQKVKLDYDPSEVIEKQVAVPAAKKITGKKGHAKKAAVKTPKPIKKKEAEPIKLDAVKAVEKDPQKSLPLFHVPQYLAKKEERFEKNLGDIVKSLETEKRGISEEKTLLKKEQRVLEKEKEKLKEEKHDKKDLPAFKIFETKISKEIGEIETKRKELETKEKDIEEKLKAAAVMERNLKELSRKLKKDEITAREKADFLDSKEKTIEKIKKELEKKYTHAITEIDSVKKDLIEKEKNFLRLQEFYNSREGKLHIEESNLLEEKRRYARLVSGLLGKHLELARVDLQKTEQKLSNVKERSEKADKALKGYEQKFRQLLAEKDKLKCEIGEKKIYFSNLEEDFRRKDPEFAKIHSLLDRRSENLAQRESAIMTLQRDLDNAETEVKRRLQSLDLKELDIKSAERDIERLKLDISNKKMRLDMHEKQFEKRFASFDLLKKDISKSIAREKRLVKRIEENLEKKGYSVSRKLSELEKAEKTYDNYHNSLLKTSRALGEEHELHLHETTISYGHEEVGNPIILDILRLLNISKDFLDSGQNDRARDAYLEIQRLFEDLEDDDREYLYPEVMKVFKTRNRFDSHFERSRHGDNIDSLLYQFQLSVDSGDVKASEQIYNKLQNLYVSLPRDEKGRYYSRIMELYNRALERQVTTGVVV